MSTQVSSPRFWRTPLDAETIPLKKGVLHVIEERCKGCGFCVEYCPKDVLVLSASFNRKGYHPPEVVSHGECVNCNLCEMICPEFAIFSVESSATVEKATQSRELLP